ncbi:TPA: T6SS effector phospholipase Tle3 domain-containing protein [Raoultella planticola]
MPERDNHGTAWSYCNPHDRVRGFAPLRSIGWQELTNTKSSNSLLITSKAVDGQKIVLKK